MSQEFQNLTDLGGLITTLPEDKIPDRNASDIANMDLSLSGMIQTSGGYTKYGQDTTAAGDITRGFLYKKNFGTFKRIKMRVKDNGTSATLEWHNPSNTGTSGGEWETLVTSLTTGKIMGFTPFNDSTANQLVFCNGTENYSIWNGSTTTYASATTNTITKQGTGTWASEGFSSTGSVIINGTTYAYTGGTGTTTLTGVTPDPTGVAHVAGDGVAQIPNTTSYSAVDKGNILLTSGARVWIAGITGKESTVVYSKTGDATNYSAGTNPADAGIEDFPDGGGAITLLDTKDNNRIVVHKEDGILIFKLDYTATAKIPQLQTLTLADDSGASNLKAGAGLNYASYFTSKTEGIKSLQRATEGADLVTESITDVVLPTIDGYDFSTAACIFYPKKRVILAACKTASTDLHNNKVIAYFIRKGAGGNYIGDISFFDWYVNDWILDGSNLYFCSSVDQNTYKAFDSKSANGVAISHKWVSKAFTFGQPSRGKEFNTLYAEGFIGEHSKLKVSVLYGILGSDGTKSEILEWDNSDYVYSQKVSALGTDTLGTLALGAVSDEIQDSFAFSVPIHFDVKKSTRFKIKFETYYDSESLANAYWAITNIAINPSLKTVERTKFLSVEN